MKSAVLALSVALVAGCNGDSCADVVAELQHLRERVAETKATLVAARAREEALEIAARQPEAAAADRRVYVEATTATGAAVRALAAARADARDFERAHEDCA